MKYFFQTFFLSATLLLSLPLLAQNAETSRIDSLIALAAYSNDDSTLLELYTEIHSTSNDVEQIVEYCNKVIAMPDIINFNDYLHSAYSDLGFAFSAMDSVDISLEYYFKAALTANDTATLVTDLINIGAVYGNSYRISQAIKYYYRALSLSEDLRDSSSLAQLYSNVGSLFLHIGIPKTAAYYFNKQRQISIVMRDSIEEMYAHILMAECLECEYHISRDPSVLYCAVSMLDTIKNIPFETKYTYACLSMYKYAAQIYLLASTTTYYEYINKADSINNIGIGLMEQSGQLAFLPDFYTNKMNIEIAKENFVEAGKTFRAIENHCTRFGENDLYYNAAIKYYKAVKNYERVFYFTTINDKMNHSIYALESVVNIATLKVQQDFDRKMEIMDMQSEERNMNFRQKSKRNNFFVSVLAAIVAIVIAFLVLRIVDLKNTNIINKKLKEVNKEIKQQNRQLEQQASQIMNQTNEILQQKKVLQQQREQLAITNQDTTASVEYASYIQKACLPSHEEFRSIFPNSFVIWKPLFIVSGDFYWVQQRANRRYVVAADCTGHGIPGGVLSMLGMSILNEIFNALPLQHNSADMLCLMREKFVKVLSLNNVKQNDGIDLALLIFDSEMKNMQYAGANRPVWIFRNNECIALRPDHLCIGININQDDKTFTNHEVSLQDGDSIYIFSDGMQDVLDSDNQKLGSSGLKDILQQVQTMPLSIQANGFNELHKEKAARVVDDRLLICIRIIDDFS